MGCLICLVLGDEKSACLSVRRAERKQLWQALQIRIIRLSVHELNVPGAVKYLQQASVFISQGMRAERGACSGVGGVVPTES